MKNRLFGNGGEVSQTGAELQSGTEKSPDINFSTLLHCQLARHGNDMPTKTAKPKLSNANGLTFVRMNLKRKGEVGL